LRAENIRNNATGDMCGARFILTLPAETTA
jgi:hypothetical protein